MYRVPFESFDGSQGDWISWSVEYTDQEFVEEARIMKRSELRQNLYEGSEGQLSFEEIDLAVEEMLARISDEDLLDEYSCFRVS